MCGNNISSIGVGAMKILKLRKQAKLSKFAANECFNRYCKSTLPEVGRAQLLKMYDISQRKATADDHNFLVELHGVFVGSVLIGCVIWAALHFVITTLLEMHG